MKRLLWISVAITALGCQRPTGLSVENLQSEPLLFAIQSSNGEPGNRPRYSPDGSLLVSQVGKEKARQLLLTDISLGQTRTFATPGDSHHPTFHKSQIVFVSNKAGKSDLYLVDTTGKGLERLTSLPGNISEPTVNPLPFNFYLVIDDGCGPPWGQKDDNFYKVAFTRQYDGKQEVWFSSIHPGITPSQEDRLARSKTAFSAHGTHQGRISPEGKNCHSPAFSNNGLNLTFVCDGIVHHAPATWTQSFADAREAIGQGSIPECQNAHSSEQEEQCLSKLPRRYTQFDGKALSSKAQNLRNPSYAANHTMLIAEAAGQPLVYDLFGEQTWNPIANFAHPKSSNFIWAPHGEHLVFDTQSNSQIRSFSTDFYLQQVTNLDQFPELLGTQKSMLLPQNQFVARPGTHKEFFALYESLRYQRRPQFVTADATLQAFRDEFMRILELAERRNTEDLQAMSFALMNHFATAYQTSKSNTDRYYAIYFAVPYVALKAVQNLVDTRDEGRDEWSWIEEGMPEPIGANIAAGLPDVLNTLPSSIQNDVRNHLQNMLAHEGIGELVVPSQNAAVAVDYSLFTIRGNYAESDLGGYFLAMTWFALAPLPFDASLNDFLVSLERVKVGAESAQTVWTRINNVVASFMGRPVDVTVSHLIEARKANPDIFSPFERQRAAKVLEELRGPVLIRDFQAADEGTERTLKVVFLPKRVGLDTTFFRQLLHPDVPMRPFPSALDAFAVMGSKRASVHAQHEQQSKEWAKIYSEKLLALTQKTPPATDLTYWSTDVYHSWLALLATLATAHDVSDASAMNFTQTDAWKDRLLFSALGGYTQLKHSAVLYNAQDMSAECGGDTEYLTFIEQPVLPIPQGFVDPVPDFFAGLERLTKTVYTQMMGDDEGPKTRWNWDEEVYNMKNLAQELNAISRAQAAGQTLTQQQYEMIEFFGARLEAITLGMSTPDRSGLSVAKLLGEGRADRGIALATDVHTNVTRNEVLQIAVGQPLDFYVITRAPVGSTLTQGGIFSFYEFHQPMSDRLTDEKWGTQLKSSPPPMPKWVSSFVE